MLDILQSLPCDLVLIAAGVCGVFFRFPCSFIYRVVRCCVQHKRDRAALLALRSMRYNDIRQTGFAAPNQKGK